MDIATKLGAETIERAAKERVPVASGTLRDAIHTDRKKVAEYEVRAGNTEAFYGHMVEHGTSHSPPHPFLVPALEEEREQVQVIARIELGKL